MILAGIAPPHIRRTVACRMECTRQTTDARHQLFHHRPAASRLKSRKSFMRTVTPLDSSASNSRLRLWKHSLTDVPASVNMGLEVAESLPAGSGEDWLCWRSLNRLRTGVGRAKTVMRRWGYLDDAQSVDCDCGEPQTMAHLLSCRLLDEACTDDDLATVTGRAKACARKWENIVWRTRQKISIQVVLRVNNIIGRMCKWHLFLLLQSCEKYYRMYFQLLSIGNNRSLFFSFRCLSINILDILVVLLI